MLKVGKAGRLLQALAVIGIMSITVGAAGEAPKADDGRSSVVIHNREDTEVEEGGIPFIIEKLVSDGDRDPETDPAEREVDTEWNPVKADIPMQINGINVHSGNKVVEDFSANGYEGYTLTATGLHGEMGSLTFSNLPYGIYRITKRAPGGSEVDLYRFYVTVPHRNAYTDSNEQTEEEWIYTIHVYIEG